MSNNNQQINTGTADTYKTLMVFFKSLRSYFAKKYPDDYAIGSIYSNQTSITYFPFTPTSLKEQKLKIAIVFNHQKSQFEVWLAGQNRQIQKKYWDIFRGSDWNKYHIPTSIDEGFSIVDNIIVKAPVFTHFEELIQQIETKTIEFINEIMKVIE